MKSSTRSWSRSVLAAAATLVLLGTSALRADTIVLVPLAPVPNGPYTTYTYEVQLAGFSAMSPSPLTSPADFCEVFDFAGYVNGSLTFTATAPGLANSDFSVSTPTFNPLTGALFGAGVAAQDDPTFRNLKMDFVNVDPYVNFPNTPITLGYLTADSIYNVFTTDTHTAQNTTSTGNSEFSINTNIVPVGAVVDVNPVPLPGAVWMGVTIFGSLGGYRGLKRIRRGTV